MLDSWEKIINPNFLNAEIIGNVGAEKIVTIEDIDIEDAFDQKTGKSKEVRAMKLRECKPVVLNKTNAKTLRTLFGEDPKNCIGKKVVLYVASVKVAGKPTTGIRIREYSEVKCEECGSEILPIIGKTVAQLVEIGKRNTGKTVCIKCMKKYAAKKQEENKE